MIYCSTEINNSRIKYMGIKLTNILGTADNNDRGPDFDDLRYCKNYQ